MWKSPSRVLFCRKLTESNIVYRQSSEVKSKSKAKPFNQPNEHASICSLFSFVCRFIILPKHTHDKSKIDKFQTPLVQASPNTQIHFAFIVVHITFQLVVTLQLMQGQMSMDTVYYSVMYTVHFPYTSFSSYEPFMPVTQ